MGIAAGRENHALGVHGDGAAVGHRALHADNRAVFIGQQLIGGAVIENLAAVALVEVGQRGGELAAVAAGLAAATLDVVDAPRGQGAVNRLDVLHLHAAIHKPLDVFGRVVAEGANQVRVHDAVAVKAHQIVVHHVRRIGEALRGLPFGTRAENLAAAARGGTAGHAGLFQNQHVRARFQRGVCGGKTRGARADDDHIHVIDRVLHRLFFRNGLERLRVAARLRDAVCDGGLDGVAGHGRAGHAVHIDGLRSQDHARQQVDRGGADAVAQTVGFGVVGDLDIGHRVLRERDFHGHGAVLARRAGGIRAGGEFAIPRGCAGRLIQTGLDGGLDGGAGHRRARYAVHIRALRFQNGGLERLADFRAQPRGFAGNVDGQIGDGAVADGDRHFDRALHALRLGRVRARGVVCLTQRAGRQSKRERQSGENPLFHRNTSSFVTKAMICSYEHNQKDVRYCNTLDRFCQG